MKKILTGGAFIVLLLMSISCSNEGTGTSNSEASELNNQLNTSRSGDRGIVLTFSNSKDFTDGILEVLSDINKEDVIILENDNTLTDVINFYSIRGNVVYLSEKHFINTQTGMIVRSLILDTDTGEYDVDNVNVPLSGEPVYNYLGTCPQGTALLGYCSGVPGSQEYGNCIGRLAADFAATNVSSGTACGNMVQSNGIFGAAICWRGCS